MDNAAAAAACAGEWLVGSKSNILVANPKKKNRLEGQNAICYQIKMLQATTARGEGRAVKEAKKTGEMCCTNLLETLTNEQYPQPG